MTNPLTFFLGPYEYRYDIFNTIKARLDDAILRHCKVFVVRLDVHFPPDYPHDGKSTDMSELIRRLKAYYAYHKVNSLYCWVREHEAAENPHHHLVLYLDGSKINNGWGVLNQAALLWERIIGTPCRSSVHLCTHSSGNSGLMIIRPTEHSAGEVRQFELARFEAAYKAALEWGSYLAKTKSKGIRIPIAAHEFGASQLRPVQRRYV